MTMALKAQDKTNITSLLSALDTAINGLDPTDRYQLGTREFLVRTRTQLLERLRHERTQ